MFEQVADLVAEHAELEHAARRPGVHADPDTARTLGRRYAELGPIVHAYRDVAADRRGRPGRGP